MFVRTTFREIIPLEFDRMVPPLFLSPHAVCLDRCHLSVPLFQSVMRGTGWVLKAASQWSRLEGRWRGSTVTCSRMKHEWPRSDSRLKQTAWGSCNRWILSFFSALLPHVVLSCSKEWCIDSNKYYSLIPRIWQDIISYTICPTFFTTVEPNL